MSVVRCTALPVPIRSLKFSNHGKPSMPKIQNRSTSGFRKMVVHWSQIKDYNSFHTYKKSFVWLRSVQQAVLPLCVANQPFLSNGFETPLGVGTVKCQRHVGSPLPDMFQLSPHFPSLTCKKQYRFFGYQ